MKKKLITLIIVIMTVIGISGCGSIDDDGSDLVDMLEELGGFGFGGIYAVKGETSQFEYNGDEIRIPYWIEGSEEEGVISEFGLLAFTDGLPQPMRLETMDGEVFREMSYLHDFILEYDERLEFELVFTPVSGSVGQQVSFIVGSIFGPHSLPESINRPNFSPFHDLFARFPDEIMINSEIQNSSTNYLEVELVELSERMIESETDHFGFFTTGTPRLWLLPEGIDHQINLADVIVTQDGRVNAQLLVYGGQEVRSRLTVFVNHQPVQVNGADFIEIQMQDEQMLALDIELVLDELDYFNSLYVMMMATGEDYLLQDDMYKSPSILLIYEGAGEHS